MISTPRFFQKVLFVSLQADLEPPEVLYFFCSQFTLKSSQRPCCFSSILSSPNDGADQSANA